MPQNGNFFKKYQLLAFAFTKSAGHAMNLDQSLKIQQIWNSYIERQLRKKEQGDLKDFLIFSVT